MPTVEEFLAHYGKKGMKWGVRNDEDSAGTPAIGRPRKEVRREAKAQKHLDRAKGFQDKIDEIASRNARTPIGKARKRRQTNELEELKAQALKDAEAKKNGKLTDKEKKLVIGGAVAAALVAGGVTYSVVQSGEGNRLAMKGKAFVQGEKPSFNKNADLAREMTPDAIMASVVPQINPNYGGVGTKVNCRRCTFAYEMRRRGYDVAATKTTNGSGQTPIGVANALRPGQEEFPTGTAGGIGRAVKESFRKAKDETAKTPFIDTANDSGGLFGRKVIEKSDHYGIFEALAKEPNGARGELDVVWGFGGGHSVAWEIIGGKPVVFDTQSGKKYTEAFDLFRETGLTIADAGYTRLDNLPLNENYLMRWLKNAG